MKKSIITSFLLLTTVAITAQQSTVVSISGGFNSSSSGSKSKTYLGNGYNLQADLFIPFARKGWDGSVKGSGKFTWGAIAGGTYFIAKNLLPEIAATQAAYKLYSGDLSITNDQKRASLNNGFIASAGLQANILLGHLSLSPSLSGGYLSIKHNGFAQRSTADSKPIVLVELPETKHSGFTLIPQIRISYPVTRGLNIYTSTAFLMGPKITVAERILLPAGGFNDQHTYEPKQLSEGTMVEKPVKTTYQSLAINAGVSWNIAGSSRRLKGKVTKPGDNGMLRTMLNTDSTKKPAGAASSSYAAGRAVQTDSTKNPLYEAGGHNGNNPVYNPAVSAKPGNPIGGIIVKGGKNPGGSMMVITSNDKGEFELKGLQTGNYQFTLTTPETTEGKSISEKGLKRNETAEAAKPGSPIGGIVVKGGKNPGGNMINLTVKEGIIQFDVLEAGNYKFLIQTPGNTNGNNSKKKKVVEKATSGLKDTLKTNV